MFNGLSEETFRSPTSSKEAGNPEREICPPKNTKKTPILKCSNVAKKPSQKNQNLKIVARFSFPFFSGHFFLKEKSRLRFFQAIYTAPPNFTALLLVAAGYIESSAYGGKCLGHKKLGFLERSCFTQLLLMVQKSGDHQLIDSFFFP